MRAALPFRTALAATVLALAACSNGATTEPLEPLAESYVLTEVDGAAAPLVIARHTLPSGLVQVYTLAFDTLRFTSEAGGSRHFELRVDTFQGGAPATPPVITPFIYQTSVLRRRNQLVVEYSGQPGSPLRPDTFTVREGSLVRQGTYGVVCPVCPPVRRVEYLYRQE